ncbi:hypothetical protein CFP71_13480 [Amycolatopsis thailandensis]|uniref:Integrase n=1 Tax=Amycolatopsis thailandensis TaxID=589330 RepID=A0A229SBX4_9PSEU|nr:hypothetical protein [Amycolatopsis thailandensis]OXM56433.1 hypothetical protein CFP71_13480 [Amycolatopsis thailandensis]
MTTPVTHLPGDPAQSPFAGQRVCEIAGLALSSGSTGPCFEDTIWDLNDLAGKPVQLSGTVLIWDFTSITHPRWQWVARELLLALLAPGHDQVAALPLAHRRALHPITCGNRLDFLTRWFNWLSEQDVTDLGDVTQLHCDRFLQHERERGLADSTILAAAVVIKDVARYGALFTTDRYPDALVPWNGKSLAEVSGYQRSGENVTQPVPPEILHPALQAALHVVETVAPHLAVLIEQRRSGKQQPQTAASSRPDEVATYLARRIAGAKALPQADEHRVAARLKNGWRHTDPLLWLAFGDMAHDLGVEFSRPAVERHRNLLEDAVAQLGIAPAIARDAILIERADGQGRVPWTLPLTPMRLHYLRNHVFNACLMVTTAVSGMRSGELMEITAASPLPPRELAADLFRFALGSTRIKGEQFGGVDDEWVVIEAAHRAVKLAARLAGTEPGESVFGRFTFTSRFNTFRNWVNSSEGARLGFAAIPDGRVTAPMLRRTLSLELAHRPNGLFAAKLHLKHISVATTEGYAARPGGSQARFRAETVIEERKHRENLTVAAFRDYQAGAMPTGPGARSLISAFDHVDAQLRKDQAAQPTVVASDRHVEMLLKKLANALHIQAANYCWFTDPRKALCLRLAGTPDATQPLAGLCDAARCPQATFHQHHRDVWASNARTTKTFLGNPRIPNGEKLRLTAEHERARQVVDAIDANATRDNRP